MTTVTQLDKLKLMARLGGLPPGTRMIEYTKTYTKTFTSRYYKLIDDQDWVSVSKEGQDDHIRTHKLIDHVYDNDDQLITPDEVDCNTSPEAYALYCYLRDQDQEPYDSDDDGALYDKVELLNPDVGYDPNDPDHQRCVDDYIKWQLDNTTQVEQKNTMVK